MAIYGYQPTRSFWYYDASHTFLIFINRWFWYCNISILVLLCIRTVPPSGRSHCERKESWSITHALQQDNLPCDRDRWLDGLGSGTCEERTQNVTVECQSRFVKLLLLCCLRKGNVFSRVCLFLFCLLLLYLGVTLLAIPQKKKEKKN